MNLLKILSQVAAMAAPSAPLPAAGMGGEHFYNAARSAGLDPDVDTLNEIVDLVNSGLTPQGAAQQVKARRGASNGLLAPKKRAQGNGLLSYAQEKPRGLLYHGGLLDYSNELLSKNTHTTGA